MWLARPLPAMAQAEIAAILRQPELALFYRFSLSDQWHSYRVLKTLQSAGHTHPDLLTAALLHDVGKTRTSLSIWARSLVVLSEALFPGRVTLWGNGPALGWRSPFVVKARHPEWGAALAQESGCRPLTVALIRRHQDELPVKDATLADQLLRALQWADDLN
jgi:hypothetical protein